MGAFLIFICSHSGFQGSNLVFSLFKPLRGFPGPPIFSFSAICGRSTYALSRKIATFTALS